MYRAIVTIELFNWPDNSEFPSLLAIPFETTEEELAFVWPAPLNASYLATRALSKVEWSIHKNPPDWEFRGLRLDRSQSLEKPDLLPGEVFLHNGAADLNAMLLRHQKLAQSKASQPKPK